MLKKALKILKKLKDHGYESYIVGGYVRDYLIGKDSSDIDICTSATPKEIKEIFHKACLPSEDYGSVILELGKNRYEITTFRKEIEYAENRKPVEIEYIKDLKEDLLRRDFTINSICMDLNKNIIDLLDGKKDLENKKIVVIGDSYSKLSEDPLRILRAIRFATILDFELDSELKYAIKRTKNLLSNVSLNRKKEELDKLFSSNNIHKGIKLIKELELVDDLELKNLDLLDSMNLTDVIGVWATLDICDIYPFSNNEKDLIKKIRKVYEEGNITPHTLYYYDLYVNSIAGDMLSIDKKDIVSMYQKLPIQSRKNLCINGKDIMKILKIEPSKEIEDILKDIEDKILLGQLDNNRKAVSKYIVKNYY